MNWKPIATAPEWNGSGKDILCRFKGQFGFVHFVAKANGESTSNPGYAAPEEWCEIED